MGWRVCLGARITHWRKWHLLPQPLLLANSLSGRSGAPWMDPPPLTMKRGQVHSLQITVAAMRPWVCWPCYTQKTSFDSCSLAVILFLSPLSWCSQSPGGSYIDVSLRASLMKAGYSTSLKCWTTRGGTTLNWRHHSAQTSPWFSVAPKNGPPVSESPPWLLLGSSCLSRLVTVLLLLQTCLSAQAHLLQSLLLGWLIWFQGNLVLDQVKTSSCICICMYMHAYVFVYINMLFLAILLAHQCMCVTIDWYEFTWVYPAGWALSIQDSSSWKVQKQLFFPSSLPPSLCSTFLLNLYGNGEALTGYKLKLGLKTELWKAHPGKDSVGILVWKQWLTGRHLREHGLSLCPGRDQQAAEHPTPDLGLPVLSHAWQEMQEWILPSFVKPHECAQNRLSSKQTHNSGSKHTAFYIFVVLRKTSVSRFRGLKNCSGEKSCSGLLSPKPMIHFFFFFKVF